MSRFDGKLEPIDLLRAQVREYVRWLDAHPEARVIVFPNGRSDTTLRNVVNRELHGFFGGMREFVTVDPADYKPGLPVDEACAYVPGNVVQCVYCNPVAA